MKYQLGSKKLNFKLEERTIKLVEKCKIELKKTNIRRRIYKHNVLNYNPVTFENYLKVIFYLYCMSLFSSNAKVQLNYRYGRKSITLDDVTCIGTEQDIMDCKHTTWGTHNCNHEEDVGVRCGKSFICLYVFSLKH